MVNKAFCKIQSPFPGMGQFETFRCDKAGEFESDEFLEISRKFGAKPQYAETDIHQHNGLSERTILTIEYRLRSLLYESGFPAYLWGQLIDTATWIYNRTAHSAIDYFTPYEKYFGKPPKMSDMRIIGSQCYVGKTKIPPGHKTETRSKIQYLVGYTDTGYRVFDPETKVTSEQCLIQIDENTLYRDVFPTHSNLSDFYFPKKNPVNTVGQVIDSEMSQSSAQPPEKISDFVVVPKRGGATEEVTFSPRKPNRKRKIEQNYPLQMVTRSKSKRVRRNTRGTIQVNKMTISKNGDNSNNDIDFEYYGAYSPDLFQPKLKQVSYKQAIKDSRWREAMQKEIDAWERLQVYSICPKTPAIQAVPTKWLLVIKNDGTFKARVVASGNLDPEKYSKSDTKSPTPKQITVKWFFAYAIRKGWSMQHIDIDNAFLHGIIDQTKYIRIPPGFSGDRMTEIGKLNRPLYGLAIAPMCWFRTFTEFLLLENFKQSLRESCVFIKTMSNNIIILILIYVDDMIVTSNSNKAIEDTIEIIEKRFRLKRLGYPSKFLGIQIERVTEHSIHIHQEDCIQALLNEYEYDKNIRPATPMMIYSQQVVGQNETVPHYPYRKLVGSLLYLANTTRLDIAFPVGSLKTFGWVGDCVETCS
jgi:hypothetical protein